VWAIRNRGTPTPMLPVLASGVLLFLYYFPHDAWGATRPALNASVLRYLLPAFAIWILFLCRSLLALRIGGLVKAAVVVAVLAGFGMSIWSGPGGVNRTRHQIAGLNNLRDQIVRATEPEALIATARLDKALFPERQTVTMTYLVRNDQPVTLGDSVVWNMLPDPERFAQVAQEIDKRGLRLYVFAGGWRRAIKGYNAALRPLGLSLRKLPLEHRSLYLLFPTFEVEMEDLRQASDEAEPAHS